MSLQVSAYLLAATLACTSQAANLHVMRPESSPVAVSPTLTHEVGGAVGLNIQNRSQESLQAVTFEVRRKTSGSAP